MLTGEPLGLISDGQQVTVEFGTPLTLPAAVPTLGGVAAPESAAAG